MRTTSKGKGRRAEMQQERKGKYSNMFWRLKKKKIKGRHDDPGSERRSEE